MLLLFFNLDNSIIFQSKPYKLALNTPIFRLSLFPRERFMIEIIPAFSRRLSVNVVQTSTPFISSYSYNRSLLYKIKGNAEINIQLHALLLKNKIFIIYYVYLKKFLIQDIFNAYKIIQF